MAAVAARQFGKELCEALGLRTEAVSCLEIKADVKEALVVTVQMFLQDDQVPKVIEVLTKYDLVPRHVHRTPVSQEKVSPAGAVDTTWLGAEHKTYARHVPVPPVDGDSYGLYGKNVEPYRPARGQPPECPSCGLDGVEVTAPADYSRTFICNTPDCVLNTWVVRAAVPVRA